MFHTHCLGSSLVVWSVTGVRGNTSRSFGTREEAERALQ